jgi:membrane fusion protein
LRKRKLLAESEVALEQKQKLDREGTLQRLNSVNGELLKEKEALTEVKARLALSESRRDRFAQLQTEGLVSREQVLDRSEDLIEQQLRTKAIEREVLSLQSQARDLEADLRAIPAQHALEVSALKQQMSDVDSDWTRSERQRSTTVVAPVDGVASTVNGDVGTNVQANTTLLALTPRGAKLQAHLFAPSSAIGFIEKGQKVHLRYRAYPYQKFGQPVGTVVSVSQTAAPVDALGFQPSSANSESLYRIIVALPAQDMAVYGTRRALQSGMRLDAEILQEKRPLYEWALEPLLTLTGTL